jgi:hypothetical protein
MGGLMRSALYYPHTSVENEDLVKTALLLWDQLEFIVPYAGFRVQYDDPLVERAMELIGAPHIPSEDEKKQTHDHIKELVNRRLPPQFYVSQRRLAHREQEFEMYPQKLFPETWELLVQARLSGGLLANFDYPMTEPGGLTIMSILADCCAGNTRSRVTDRGSAYATLAGLLGSDSGNEDQEASAAEEQLVPIALEVINALSIDLLHLIALREREKAQGGHAISDLRHRTKSSTRVPREPAIPRCAANITDIVFARRLAPSEEMAS